MTSRVCIIAFDFVRKVSKWMTFATVTLSNLVSSTGLDVFEHVASFCLSSGAGHGRCGTNVYFHIPTIAMPVTLAHLQYFSMLVPHFSTLFHGNRTTTYC